MGTFSGGRDEGAEASASRTMSEDENTLTFVLEDEDHTLGATLVDVLNRSALVTFAGYTIPHPSERKVQLCVQTLPSTTPKEALLAAAESLSNMCKSTEKLFTSKVEEFDNAMRE